MGGVATDHQGRSSLPGLWCVGECASTGLHGANRLASNSLLEALVFGARVAESVKSSTAQAPAAGLQLAPDSVPSVPLPQLLRETMSRHVGLERDEAGLRRALGCICGIERAAGSEASLLNVIAAAKLAAAAALLRRESFGAHFRSDYPQARERPQRSFLTLAEADRVARENEDAGESRSRALWQ
jgi:L-aspartate oxidase